MALDLRQLRESATDEPPRELELVDREHQFTVHYTAPDGKAYTDEVVSRILDGDERILVARIAARRAACVWEHLPATHAARIWAIATVAVQLRDPPDWVGQWAVEDDTLLFSIFDVLQTHESFFFRGVGTPGQTEKSSSRVAVHTSLATRPAPKPA
jgi:hypothetical protein